MQKTVLLILFLLLLAPAAIAQKITGKVTDKETGEPLGWVQVYYQDQKGSGVPTREDGSYSIPYRKGKILCFSMMGYETQTFNIERLRPIHVSLSSRTQDIREVEITRQRKRYSRKDNPAVALMQKVIAAKKKTDLHEKDFFSYNRYQKLTFGLNEVTERVFEEGQFKRMPFLKDHVEVCEETGKLILPLTVNETVSRHIYRKEPKSEKEIVTGIRSNGINELFNTGEVVNTLIKDCFTDVNIYDNEIRLLQFPFISPISSTSAIRFYRYFIVDTLEVHGEKCIRVDFTPNNPQDFGFAGSLYILADSSWQVRRVEMGIPKRSDVNFVEQMNIIQEYNRLPTGEYVLTDDKMIVQLFLIKSVQKFQVERTTTYQDYAFTEIPDKTFKFRGKQKTDPSAMMRNEAFWNEQRPKELTASEGKMNDFIKKLESIKGFNFVLFVAKAFIENHVEVTADPEKPSPVDIGPINTIITHNFVEGLRLRASAQTTANLHPHLFGKGYVAYGFGDHRWKGMGELTYSFNKKDYLPREFPVHNLSFSYARDVMSPSDKFLPTDKDNVFISFKWTPVEHMQYYERFAVNYDREWENGLRFNLRMKRETSEPTGALFYEPMNGRTAPSNTSFRRLRYLTTTDATVGITYQPGATWINSKQHRLQTNQDAPILGLEHTTGVPLLGGDYTYNFTEATLYKRLWLRSWGRMDFYVKGGIQWNKVPFPLLIMPAANLSYIIEDNTFHLIDNMEFLNDRYSSLMFSWDMNGKILNRIPLINRLQWREFIGCNVLWGTLTDKNNPFLAQNLNDPELFYFPGNFDRNGQFTYKSGVMNPKVPYVELVVGVHNIFKLFHVEYVRRMNYLKEDTQKWGVRFLFRMSF